MKYYYLTNSINLNEVGCFPQSESIHNNIDFEKLNINNVNLNYLPIPLLKSKAKLTTYLLSVPVGNTSSLILKKDFIEFLKPFLLEKYLHAEILIYYKNKDLHDYELFYLYKTVEREIENFKKSIFYKGSRTNWQYIGEKIEIPNYNEYVKLFNFNDNDETIKVKELHLDFSSLKTDMLRIERFPLLSGYFISEKLKNAIEEKGFTGMAFQEIEEMDKRIKAIY